MIQKIIFHIIVTLTFYIVVVDRKIFKNLQYDSMRRLDLFSLPCEPQKLEAYMADIDVISPQAPWTCQAFVKGQEYSSCAIAHEGSVTMFTDNAASISCFNYKYQGDERLYHWVRCTHAMQSWQPCSHGRTQQMPSV